MLFGVPGLKRTLSAFSVFGLLGFGLISCNSYKSPSSGGGGNHSGIKFRAFVSNPLQPAGSGSFPALNIVDAAKDDLNFFYLVSLLGSEPDAGMMAESPKRDRTLVFSPSNHGLAVVDNATESVAGSLTLPGATESMFVWTDDTTAFVAVPNAPVTGQIFTGAVGRIDISSGAVTATISVPGARFLVPSPDGTRILVISDSLNTVTLLDPNLITAGNALFPITPPLTAPFDKPVAAVFSADGSTAYVLNCGPECGGSLASVSVLDMTQTPPVVQPTLIPTPGGATMALLQGSNLYVAGSPPLGDCTAANPATAATACGRLTTIDRASQTASAPVTITDGYHDHMQMGANGQLFIGSRNCTNINVSGGEVRGCLAIFNTVSGAVVIPPDNGSVTGIEPIPNRTVVYVCEGGALRIYDTITDKLQVNPAQPSVVGQAVDVKVVDF
jgi:hypothetical protein